MDREKLKGEIKKIKNLLESTKDEASTYLIKLCRKDDNQWAMVFANNDYDKIGKLNVYGKIAYQPSNSIMQEYDIDWFMPCFPNSDEVYDTEVKIVNDDDIDYLLNDLEKIIDIYNLK